MSKKPLIGLLGHKHSGTGQLGYGQNAAYVGYFRRFGDVIILDAQCETTLPLDLLVLPGGRDVNPANYGQAPWLQTQAPDLEYEYFMKNKLADYIERVDEGVMGIYGICAGFQHLVSYFGGELTQDIYQEQSKTYERGELVDELEFDRGTLSKYEFLDESFKRIRHTEKNFHMTNSIHHQGTYKDQVSEFFNVIATNRHYGNVEFVISDDGLVAAEQSHPEERLNPILSNTIINNILKLVENEK